MSRTKRNLRPKMKLGQLSNKQYWDKKVSDGNPQHSSKSCNNNGGCPYCDGNKLHKHKRNKPIEE